MITIKKTLSVEEKILNNNGNNNLNSELDIADTDNNEKRANFSRKISRQLQKAKARRERQKRVR